MALQTYTRTGGCRTDVNWKAYWILAMSQSFPAVIHLLFQKIYGLHTFGRVIQIAIGKLKKVGACSSLATGAPTVKISATPYGQCVTLIDYLIIRSIDNHTLEIINDK